MKDSRSVRLLGLTPYFYFEDTSAALEWLSRVFGFEERRRFLGNDGRVREAVMRAGDAALFVGEEMPASGNGAIVTRPTGQQSIVYVEDVDAHYERARAAGLQVASPEKACGSRVYRAEDPGGHWWTFSQHRGLPRFRSRADREG